MTRPIERIAIVRALHLGDMLLAVPAFRAIRRGFPDAQITLIGLPWARAFAERYDRYIDRFAEFGGFPGVDEMDFDPHASARFLNQQRAEEYDLVVQMHGSGRTSNPLALALGGVLTIGYHEPGTDPHLDVSAPYPTTAHEVDRNLGLAAMLGCPAEDRHLAFPLRSADISEAQKILNDLAIGDRPIIGVHPGAKYLSRRWMPERFAAVAAAVAKETSAAVVVTGTDGERELAADIAGRVGADAFLIAGATTLGGLAALIDRMALFISNDTGPAHIACALGTPSVTIFGPADIRRWAPEQNELHAVVHKPVLCSPCGYSTCPIDHRCLRSIGVADVLQAAHRVLNREAETCVA